MEMRGTWSVGDVARLAGVTVRTLHHYDRIGLLTPTSRSGAGYREYGREHVARLQRILAYRELGFGLDDVARLLDDPDADPVEHLRRQHGLVLARMERLAQVAAVLERTIDAHEMGITMSAEEMLEVFGDHDPAQYEGEVRERWGDTEAYRQSRERTIRYTKRDWIRVKAEQQAPVERLAAAMNAGASADSTEAMDAAEQARLAIDRNFYDLSPQAHVGLAQMYVSDPRFTKTYEDVTPGLAHYVHDAIVANAARSAG